MAKTQYFSRRSHLDLRHADLWQIQTGVVRGVTWIEDGSSITLGFWGAGDVIGNSLLQHDRDELECLSAVTASPLLAESCSNRVTSAYIQQLQELLIIRSSKRIEERLLKLLTWMGNRFGSQQEAGIKLKLLLTHQDLAEVLGTTRVTITRTMGKLESQGIIRDLTQRWLFIDRSACLPIVAVADALRAHLPISVSSSSILPNVGVVSLSRERSLSISYR
jgi:CRP-like cAMP-binding protein